MDAVSSVLGYYIYKFPIAAWKKSVTTTIFYVEHKRQPLVGPSGELWCVFCGLNTLMYSLPQSRKLGMKYEISRYIGSRYNGTRLF